VRVELSEYRKALFETLLNNGAPLIEMFGIDDTMKDMWSRLNDFDEHSVYSRLMKGIIKDKQKTSPLAINSDEFNYAAEGYYRNDLKKRHMQQALLCFGDDLRMIDKSILSVNDVISKTLRFVLQDQSATQLLNNVMDDVVEERINLENLIALIHLVLVVEYIDQLGAKNEEYEDGPAPIYRAGNS
jgi:hypothetical protein